MSDFKSKMHQIQFRLGLPDPLAGFKGPTSKGREGREGGGGRGGEWDGREGKGREGGREGEGRERGEEVEGPGKWSAPGPVLALG